MVQQNIHNQTAIIFNIFPTLLAKEFVSFYDTKDGRHIKTIIIKRAKQTLSSIDLHANSAIAASLAGVGCVALMALLASLFIYQRRRSTRPILNAEYMGKFKQAMSNGKEFVANGGILNDESSLDKRLAQTAHLYQYQHQKQQMLSLQKQMSVLKDNEEMDSEDEIDEDGDYTVYECPGLASASEMEVKNPLFNDSAINTSAGSSRED